MSEHAPGAGGVADDPKGPGFVPGPPMRTGAMSEHTPLTEAERGDHFPTTPVQCFCGWRETDPDAGTWTSHLLAARTSTATAPVCSVATWGVPTDDDSRPCLHPAVEEWLDLTGQWSPVCEAHGRGAGVPEDRLRPLAATADTGLRERVEALADEWATADPDAPNYPLWRDLRTALDATPASTTEDPEEKP